MEEAIELYTLMDGMLRASEAARVAMVRAPPTAPTMPPAPERGPPPRTGPPPGAAAPAGAGVFLLGILAMGAGAGLLAAMTKRMQDLAPPAPAPDRSATKSNAP